MKAVLIRHAPTAGNLQSNYIGSTDEPLSPEGIRLAESIGPDDGVKRVYASGLQRARQTARILFPQAAIIVRDGLNEMNFGAFEGKNWKDLDGDARYSSWLETKCESRCPGGEDKAGFTSRCREAFRALMDEAALSGADGILHIVTHGGVIMSIMSGFAEPGRDYFEWKTGFCEGFVIEADDGERFRLVEPLTVPRRREEA